MYSFFTLTCKYAYLHTYLTFVLHSGQGMGYPGQPVEGYDQQGPPMPPQSGDPQGGPMYGGYGQGGQGWGQQ